MYDLFQSEILNYHFDFDEWPATSLNQETKMKPYSGSLFGLRFEFPTIYPQLYKENLAFEKKNSGEVEKKNIIQRFLAWIGDLVGTVTHLPIGHHEEEKVYKIKYSLNILPSLNDGCEGDLMEAIIGTDENEIFISEAVMDMVDYKWDTYAFKTHMIGAVFHLIYSGCLIAYIDHTFLVEPTHDAIGTIQPPKCNIKYMYILFGCLVYPTFYDGTQMVK